jgi:hypothetical protein
MLTRLVNDSRGYRRQVASQTANQSEMLQVFSILPVSPTARKLFSIFDRYLMANSENRQLCAYMNEWLSIEIFMQLL